MADTLTIQLAGNGQLPVTCPAGEPLAAVRRSVRQGAGAKVRAEVPGVLCRVVHEPMDLVSDPSSPGVFCCHPGAGYRRCPIWEYDKGLIAAGMHSMGDERAAAREDEQVLRDDLTGSRYGDVSWLDQLAAEAERAVADMRDVRSDGFIRAQGGES